MRQHPRIPRLQPAGVRQKTVPEKAKENDVFWVVEKGVYMCPGNQPFEFKQ